MPKSDFFSVCYSHCLTCGMYILLLLFLFLVCDLSYKLLNELPDLLEHFTNLYLNFRF